MLAGQCDFRNRAAISKFRVRHSGNADGKKKNGPDEPAPNAKSICVSQGVGSSLDDIASFPNRSALS